MGVGPAERAGSGKGAAKVRDGRTKREKRCCALRISDAEDFRPSKAREKRRNTVVGRRLDGRTEYGVGGGDQ